MQCLVHNPQVDHYNAICMKWRRSWIKKIGDRVQPWRFRQARLYESHVWWTTKFHSKSIILTKRGMSLGLRMHSKKTCKCADGHKDHVLRALANTICGNWDMQRSDVGTYAWPHRRESRLRYFWNGIQKLNESPDGATCSSMETTALHVLLHWQPFTVDSNGNLA